MEKSVDIAGILLEMSGLTNTGKGSEMASEILSSGKALTKFREIIEFQGGNPNIKFDEIEGGSEQTSIYAKKDGYVVGVNNKSINAIAKAAGCPKDKEAGIIIHKRQGEYIHGDPLITIFANSDSKLTSALQTANTHSPIILEGMVLRRIGSIPEKYLNYDCIQTKFLFCLAILFHLFSSKNMILCPYLSFGKID